MKKETKEVFTSFDGTIFDNEKDCLKYENEQKYGTEREIKYFRISLKNNNIAFQIAKTTLSRLFIDWLTTKHELASLLANKSGDEVEYYKKVSRLSEKYAELLERKKRNEDDVKLQRDLIKADRAQLAYYKKILNSIEENNKTT